MPSKIKALAKGLVLKLQWLVNPQAYWDMRYKLQYDKEVYSLQEIMRKYNCQVILKLLDQYDCQTVLEVGCGLAEAKDVLPGYMGLDYSLVALEKSGLSSFIYADITRPNLPIPAKSYDCVLTHAVLMHIDYEGIEPAIDNMCRIAKHLIICKEQYGINPSKMKRHCFVHDLPRLFKRYPGAIVFL